MKKLEKLTRRELRDCVDDTVRGQISFYSKKLNFEMNPAEIHQFLTGLAYGLLIAGYELEEIKPAFESKLKQHANKLRRNKNNKKAGAARTR